MAVQLQIMFDDGDGDDHSDAAAYVFLCWMDTPSEIVEWDFIKEMQPIRHFHRGLQPQRSRKLGC